MGNGVLTEEQLNFLEVMQASELADAFYLTGGTALAGFYLSHRDSEDLNFFTEQEVDPLVIDVFLKSKKDAIGFESVEFQKSFNRNLFFLHSAAGVLKTEFTYFPFTRIEPGKKQGKLHIDSLRDIAVNKVFTISQKPRARDFVDLFFILKQEPWQFVDLLKDARIKFGSHIDPMQLGAQLLKVRELKDLPRMHKAFKQNEIEDFFLTVAQTFGKDIF